MRSRAEFSVALLLEIIGAAGVLLVSTRTWQTVTTQRPRPFAADVLHVTGRTIDTASTALALVGLAGVVAVLATKGVVRQAVGALVALAGAGIVWRSLSGLPALSAARADALVRDKHQLVAGAEVVGRHVSTTAAWAIISAIGGALVLLAGALIAWRGGRWSAMSAKYEAPAPEPEEAEHARAKADARMWTAMERGEDPTADDPTDLA